MKFLVYLSLIFYSAWALSQPQTDKNNITPYSLTISGGVSLGNYEAGMNWVLIETLRKIRYKSSDKNNPYGFQGQLHSITGASAGSINTLISALRYCQSEQQKNYITSSPGYDLKPHSVKNNLFYSTWIDIGLNKLLPSDRDQYDSSSTHTHKDGLLTRNAFTQVIKDLKFAIDNPNSGTKKRHIQYEEGCTIALGMSLTRENAARKITADIHIMTQRFFVPLLLTIKNNKPLFTNNTQLDINNHLGNIIYLPVADTKSRKIGTQNIIDVALASSAFPIAFGRVSLDICEDKNSGGQHPGKPLESSRHCPKIRGHKFSQKQVTFIDGGVFDNIPLGVSMLFMGDHKSSSQKAAVAHKKHSSYIFMDPANIRHQKYTEEHKETIDLKDYSLRAQLGFLDDTINIGMNNELYSTLRKYDWNLRDKYNRPVSRRLLVTSRGTRLTADYLAHFAAFMSDDFRQYDYYVGIYDGVYNSSREICFQQNRLNQQCTADYFQKLYNNLGLKQSTDFNQILFALASDDGLCKVKSKPVFCSPTPKQKTNKYQLLNSALITNSVDCQYEIKEEKDKKFPNFSNFLCQLQKEKPLFSKETQDVLKKGKYWYISYSQLVAKRLNTLEQNSKHQLSSTAVSIVNYAANSYSHDQNNYIWSVSSAPNDISWYSRVLIPDALGTDFNQSGAVFSWYWQWQYRSTSIEPEFTYHWLSNINNREDFYNIGVNFRWRTSETFSFSSVGLGAGRYQSYDISEFDSVGDYDIRAQASVGLMADKFRISYGQRVDGNTNERKNSRMLMFTINDIRGTYHWLFGR